MKNFFFSVLFLIISISTVQSNNFKYDSHKIFLEQAKQSNEITYKDILAHFDAFITDNPDDITSVIEKCSFIEVYSYSESDLVYFDSLEQNDIDCESQLSTFPETSPERIMYKLSSKWNDEAIEIFNEAETSSLQDWSIENKTRIYSMMDTKSTWKSPPNYEYANRGFVETKNPMFTIGAANHQFDSGNRNQAIEILQNYQPKSQDNKVELVKLYLKLGLAEDASKTFELIESKKDIQNSLIFKLKTSIDNQYQPTIEEFESIQALWNFEVTFQDLYNHSIHHKNYKVAHSIYQFRSSKDFWYDPFSYSKFKLYQQSTKWSLNINDFYSLLMWLSLILGSILTMFLVIAPIHYRGLYRRIHNKPQLNSMTNWNLKHALFLGSMFILVDIVLSIIFQYQSVFTMFFSDTEMEFDITSGLPSKMYFYYSFLILGLGLLIYKPGKDLFKVTVPNLLKSTLIAFGIFIVLKIIIVASAFFYKISTLTAEINFTQQTILDLRDTYGTLTVYLTIALLTPLVEEYLFRGVFLNSFTKHISFGWANTIQAALFALIHENTQLFLYYFAVGLIAGILVKKQKHIYGALAFHIINNALAVTAINSLIL
jgi:membrane protease YdiL (CAAX protease family)